MIPLDEARSILLKEAKQVSQEQVPLSQASGRVLAADILADRDVPIHPLSAMDGFACRRQDTAQRLRVLETLPAGHIPTRQIGPGECSRIMTGSIVPKGADIVVMFEHASTEGDWVRVVQEDSRSNIRKKGENVRAGDTVLKRGARIDPPVVAVLASVGCDPVPVARRPHVAILATGSELVEPCHIPGEAQIRNSNSYQLAAQTERIGCVASNLGIAPDTPEQIDHALKEAMAISDVVLLSGGVSMGDFDFVPQILKDNGVELRFESIAIKPGRPTVFGVRHNQFLFGLPGNPVSTFVVFELLVRPFLEALMGKSSQTWKVFLELAKEIKRKRADRDEFRPVRVLENGHVEGLNYLGSGHIHAYVNADGMVMLPAGASVLEKGSHVQIHLL